MYKVGQQFFTDAFIAMMTDIIKWRNEKEFDWPSPDGNEKAMTVEFPTNSPRTAIIRYYYPTNQIYWSCEYKKGLRNGECRCYKENGRYYYWSHFKNDKLHGKSFRWRDWVDGPLESEENFVNGSRHGICVYYKSIYQKDIDEYDSGKLIKSRTIWSY